MGIVSSLDWGDGQARPSMMAPVSWIGNDVRYPASMSSPKPLPPELPDLLPPPAQRRSFWLRALYIVGAIVCLALGVIGWLIPVVSGLPFYAAGLLLLGMASTCVAEWINHHERRLPHGVRQRLRRWVGRRAEKPR
jgi:hypothetical protein